MADANRPAPRVRLAGALPRPLYEIGNYLSAADLQTEQRYRLQRLRRHNWYVHGWGVVCGLQVVPARDPAQPWAVQVCPGYAIGPYGDEIEVTAPARVDVREYLWRQPSEPLSVTRVAYVGIRHVEQHDRPVSTQPNGCGCGDTADKFRRIRDGFQADVLWVLPPDAGIDSSDLCVPSLALCPECPEGPYLLLACVTLPRNEANPVTAALIDNWTCRRAISLKLAI